MKIALLLLIGVLGITCHKKDSFQEAFDRADEAPKRYHVQGIYQSIDKTDRTTLCLSGPGYGHYFILRDTTIIKSGKWDYDPPTTEGADYTVAKPGCGRINFDWPSKGENWSSNVCFEGSGKDRKVVLTGLDSYTGKLPSFLHEATYGYEKVLKPYERK
jgi:hypothetical protein